MEDRSSTLLVIDAEILQAELGSSDPDLVIEELREYADAALERRSPNVPNPTGVVIAGSYKLQ